METTWDIGIAMILFLQGLGEWLTGPMEFLSFLGTQEFYLLFMPALYWCWDDSLGLRLGLLLMSSVGLNSALKLAFHSPRPYWVLPQVKALSSHLDFGLPSGHAQQAVTFWGFLGASLHRRWARVAALALIILIGLSRVYLAVHSPTDVILGWLIGTLLLWAFLQWQNPVRDWLRQRSVAQLVLISFLASMALIGMSTLALASLGDWQVPTSWHQNALASAGQPPDPLSLANTLTAAGTLFGMCAGAAWILNAGGFRSDGPIGKRLARFALGLVGVILLWRGLGSVFPDEPILLGYGLRYLRYALIGAWVSAGAPALFVRLRLAEKQGGSTLTGANPS